MSLTPAGSPSSLRDDLTLKANIQLDFLSYFLSLYMETQILLKLPMVPLSSLGLQSPLEQGNLRG